MSPYKISKGKFVIYILALNEIKIFELATNTYTKIYR